MLLNVNKINIHNLKIKPILKWAGGKSALLKQLLPLFPNQFNRYFEPFLGGGAVFFAIHINNKKSYLNDANKELIDFYEVVRDEPQALMKQLDYFTKNYSEEFYYELRTSFSKTKIMRAARTLFLNKTGFNGLYRQNAKGEFNVPFGKRLKCPALYEIENFLLAAKALQTAQLFSADFEEIINMAGKDDFIYCDPPYEPLSKTSNFNAYQANGFSQDQQRRLKEACLRAQKRGAFVIISNSSAEFIKELYKDCELKFLAAKRVINSKGDKRGEINEVAVILPALSGSNLPISSYEPFVTCEFR